MMCELCQNILNVLYNDSNYGVKYFKPFLQSCVLVLLVHSQSFDTLRTENKLNDRFISALI